MDNRIYEWYIKTGVDAHLYTEPIKANLHNILDALCILTTFEFQWWVKLCKFSPDIHPDCIKGIEADIIATNLRGE